MAVKSDADFIPDELWESFRPTRISRWRPAAFVVGLLVVPLVCVGLVRVGIPRPNIEINRSERYEYLRATDVVLVDWQAVNRGYFDVTLTGLEVDGLAAGDASVNLPGRSRMTMRWSFQHASNACARNSEDVVRYDYWTGAHAMSMSTGLSICEFLKRLAS